MILILVLLILYHHAYSFNLDIKHAQVLEDPQRDTESYFGYSLSFYNNSLVVGAPRGKDKFHSNSTRPGVAYNCDFSGLLNCSQIKLTNLKAEKKNNVTLDDAWMGSAIAAHESRGILVCGRLIKETAYTTESPPNGGCYLKKNIMSDEDSKLLLPFFDGNNQGVNMTNGNYSYYGHGQAGMSAMMTKDGNEIVLGAPGFGTGVGTLIRYHYDEKSEDFIKTPPEPSSVITLEGLYQYMGYAVASGNFVNGTEAFVGGAPRADRGKGKVVLMTPSNDTNAWNKLKSETGEKIGDGYGSTLAAADINGDKFDDLLVGAPRAGDQDAGRVYVYLGSSTILNFENPKKIDGDAPWMQFGTTVASIGDINQDGCQDFAVGVPFDRDGVIYIYLGDRSEGFRNKAVQRIAAADLGGFRIKGFGISIVGGKDIDGNGVKDLAVGSFESGHVVLLRARPPLRLEPSFPEPSPLVPITASFIDISVCLTYTGSLEKSVDAFITVSDDVKAEVISEVKLFKTSVCSIVKWNIMDKEFFAPINLTARARLVNRDNSTEFCKHCPVADPDSPVANTTAFYGTNCKNNSACVGDIYITAEFKNVFGPVTISPNTLVSIKVTVKSTENSDPAYMVEIKMMFNSTNVKLQEPAFCRNNSGIFECPIQPSLSAGHEIELNVVLDISDIFAGTESLELNISAKSMTEDDKPENNVWTRTLPLNSKADATVIGDSDKPFIDFNEMEANSTRILSAEHTFEVQNKGPALIEKVTILFSIPSEIKFKDTHRRIINIKRPVFTDLNCTHISGPEFSIDTPNMIHDIAEAIPQDVKSQKKAFCNADNVTCTVIECESNKISTDMPIKINFNLLFDPHVLAEILSVYDLEVISKAELKGLDGIQGVNILPDFATCSTMLIGPLPKPFIATWIWVVPTLGGLLIVGILVIVLYKCNFFKRKQFPPVIQEEEEEVDFNDSTS